MKIPEAQLNAVAFSEPAKFSNEASITSDQSGMHRVAFLEIDPDGGTHHVCAVFLSSQMLMRLHEIFGQRLGATVVKPSLIRAN